jgi:gentisate 1,2-dioxygenase
MIVTAAVTTAPEKRPDTHELSANAGSTSLASPFEPVVETPSDQLDLWPSYIIPKEAIDAEIERLASGPRSAEGWRRSLIRHPRSDGAGRGLAPGIRVTLEVLLPGESTPLVRHNSTQVVFCIQGGGRVIIDARSRRFGQYDVWVTPSMATYRHTNGSDTVQARLVYSNAALLEKLNVHYIDTYPAEKPVSDNEAGTLEAVSTPFEQLFQVAEDDMELWLMSYERLVNPPVQESVSLMWPWRLVKPELDKLHALGPSYKGRRLYLLYNPSTGRTNGTTYNFFATMTIRPAGIADRPHRHTAAAINYFFRGSGHSVVGGKVYQWKAGDLMLSAPGWEVHNHVSHDDDVYELTVQDSPLHLAMDSLLWQEDMKRDPILIGSHHGWNTNRDVVS